MILSEKNKKTIDACRFCWMCRHICPIGNATGQERNTARARALNLSLVLRGAEEMTSDAVDNIYECACCGACAKDCQTGWDPVPFVREVRLQMALEQKSPDYVQKMVEKLMRTGNVYGVGELDPVLQEACERHNAKEDTLLFLGSDARFRMPETAVRTIALLEKAGMAFTVLTEEPSSGAAMYYLVGAAEETRQQQKTVAETMNDYSKVIVYDPEDAKFFLREGKEWNAGITAQVMTFTSCLEGLLADGSLQPKKSEAVVTYQDPFSLARELEETEPTRNVIRACAELKEMLLNRKDTMWAGNLLMAEYMPKVMEMTARARIQEAENVGVKTMITASVSEYAALKKVACGDQKVLSIEELVWNCLE